VNGAEHREKLHARSNKYQKKRFVRLHVRFSRASFRSALMSERRFSGCAIICSFLFIYSFQRNQSQANGCGTRQTTEHNINKNVK
jgi:hypothetical protein